MPARTATMITVALGTTMGLTLPTATPALAQEMLVLDDFDTDNSDELFSDQGLLAIFTGTLPFLLQDESYVTPGDIGAVRYSDPDAADTLVAGQYPNDAGAEGASLGLNFEDLEIIGLEIDIRSASDEFLFGFTLEDDGPSGTVERKVAVVDLFVPAGDSTVRTLFTDPEWIIEDGFDFTEIRALFYGFNNEPRSAGLPRPIDDIALEFTELRAILGQPCAADIDGDGDLTLFDFLLFQNQFDLGDPAADFDEDGDLTLFDFLAFQNAFDAGCP